MTVTKDDNAKDLEGHFGYYKWCQHLKIRHNNVQSQL